MSNSAVNIQTGSKVKRSDSLRKSNVESPAKDKSLRSSQIGKSQKNLKLSSSNINPEGEERVKLKRTDSVIK